jgi:glycosyltransferase involved in cell wall biosynthesis
MARLLALDAYHGGAHRAFLEGWRSRSRHGWTVLTLPARHWKWRMRHAAFTLADEARRLAESGQSWDAVFCTDMLNLAEFRGLAGESIARLSAVAYFHENQLTYPDADHQPRDLQFAMTNVLTALAADAVWFNSAFHREEFPGAAERWLRRMPDHQPAEAVRSVRDRSDVQQPGIERFEPRTEQREPGPLRLVWAARWERDKAPATLFEALRQLADRGIEFRVSVLGPASERKLGRFEPERQYLGHRVHRWGYLESREAYRETLRWADAFISTARQEFFGIAVAEAAAAGCIPVLPNRLAYPEVMGDAALYYEPGPDGHEPTALADHLAEVADRIHEPGWRSPRINTAQQTAAAYHWDRRAAEMDDAVERLVANE